MAEYFTGSDRDLRRFARQMEELHEVQDVVVIGDVGRQATYAVHQYEQADPLALKRGLDERARNDTPRRLVDVVMPYGIVYREAELNPDWFNGFPVRTVKHKVWWQAPGGYGLVGSGTIHTLGEEVLQPYTRTVQVGDREIPIRTFGAGTQYYVQSLYEIPGVPRERDMPPRDRKTFHDFLHKMYGEHPEEFLADVAYQGFRDAHGRMLPSPWIDLETLRQGIQVQSGSDAGAGHDVATHARPRETVTLQAVQRATAALGSSSLELVLAGVARAEDIAVASDNSVLRRVAVMSVSLDAATDYLQGATEGAGEDAALHDALEILAEVREHASVAAAALQHADAELQTYSGAIGGNVNSAGDTAGTGT